MSKKFLPVSEAVTLGIHALVNLAGKPGRLVSVHEIAGTYRVSAAHLAKVMQRLSRADLVSSTRGPRGGFALARPASEISLLAIYEALEGPLPSASCLLPTPVCGGRSCILGDLMGRINHLLREYLAGTRLDQFAGAAGGGKKGGKADGQAQNHPD